MGSLGAFRTPILAAGLTLVVAAGCSSSGKKTTPTTSSTVTSTSSTSIPAPSTSESSTTPATSAPATTAPAVTTTTTPPLVRITSFTVSPASPVCNGPTMIQLTWFARGATSVDLSIDGAKFASYSGGAQSHLEYYACDGHPHTYTLIALAPSASDSASKVVTSTPG